MQQRRHFEVKILLVQSFMTDNLLIALLLSDPSMKPLNNLKYKQQKTFPHIHYIYSISNSLMLLLCYSRVSISLFSELSPRISGI